MKSSASELGQNFVLYEVQSGNKKEIQCFADLRSAASNCLERVCSLLRNKKKIELKTI